MCPLKEPVVNELQLKFNFPSTKVSLVQFPISLPPGFLKEAISASFLGVQNFWNFSSFEYFIHPVSVQCPG